MNANITYHDHNWKTIEQEQTYTNSPELQICECGLKRQKLKNISPMFDQEQWVYFLPTYSIDATK